MDYYAGCISIYFYFLSFRPGESDSCQPDHVLFCHTDLRRHHRTYAFIRSLIIKQFNRDGRKRIPFWSYVTAKGKISRAFAPYDPVFLLRNLKARSSP